MSGRVSMAVVAAAVLLSACTSGGAVPPTPSATGPTAGATPTSDVPSAGAAGVGDAYYPLDGNGGYDALHYDIAVTIGPGSHRLAGTATITARAGIALSRFNLDLHGLTVTSVAVDGTPARWTRTGQELVVTPAAPLAAEAEFRTEVRYGGSPTTVPGGDIDNGWYATSDGATVLGEPQGASVWFPVNEHPRDKATYDVAITVPTGLTAISNGILVGEPVARGGRTTWTWRHGRPMASYLVLLAVGRFDIRRSTTSTGLPILDAVDPAIGDAADAELARQGEIIDVLSDAFGPYPFEAAGAVVDVIPPVVALETQTRSLYSAEIFTSGEDGTWTVVHETAHQWFGDSVSLRSWQDVWLNEGFATYAEWIWSERTQSFDPTTVIPQVLAEITEDDPFWATDISDPGTKELFGPAVYQRGALVLEALRETVGDAAFFTILRTWAADHRDANGTTDEFVALAEETAGRDLAVVWDTWLFGSGKPSGWSPSATPTSSGPATGSPSAWDGGGSLFGAGAATS
jgi:aminopeptidase N